MYFKDGDRQDLEAGPGFKGILIGLAVIILILGIFPQWLTNLLDNLVYIG